MLSKTIDDPWFDRLTTLEWKYYQIQLHLDEEESDERTLEFVEYLAAFHNPKAVQQIKQKRKGKNGDGVYTVSDEQFAKQVERMFKKPLKTK